MYSILITIVAVIFIALYLRVRWANYVLKLDTDRAIAEQENKYFDLADQYRKSEEGITEICENYENDAMNLHDTISSLENSLMVRNMDVADRDLIIENHAKHCHGLVADTIDMLMEKLKPGHSNFIHNHPFPDSCDSYGCETDRYLDGVHEFSNVNVVASSEGWWYQDHPETVYTS